MLLPIAHSILMDLSVCLCVCVVCVLQIDFANVDFQSGKDRSTDDDVLTFKDIHLSLNSVNSLLHYFGIPFKLKEGYIKRVTAKGMNISNLLAANVDSSFEIDGVYLLLESTGPIMDSQPSAAKGADSKSEKAGKQMGEMFTNPALVKQIFDLLASIHNISLKNVNIRMESVDKANGKVDALGIVWKDRVFQYGPLSAEKSKLYGIHNLNQQHQSANTTFDTKAVTLDLPHMYFNKSTQPVSANAGDAQFVTAMSSALPKTNGFNNEYLLLAGEGEFQLVLRFKIGKKTEQPCCIEMCMPCLACLQFLCCCSVPIQAPNVEDVQLVGLEVAFHRFEVNMTTEMLPMLKGMMPLEAILFKLGNTGILVDDSYTFEYMIYSTLLTRLNHGHIVARDLGTLAGSTALGGPGAWIHLITPDEGQPVGTFLLSAPNDQALFPSLVIDMGYRSNDHVFPGDDGAKKEGYIKTL